MHTNTCAHRWNKRKTREDVPIQTCFSLNGFQICFLIRLNYSYVLWQVAAQPNHRIHSKITFQAPVNTLAVASDLAALAGDSSWMIWYAIQEQENLELYAYWKSNSVFLACAVCTMHSRPSQISSLKSNFLSTVCCCIKLIVSNWNLLFNCNTFRCMCACWCIRKKQLNGGPLIPPLVGTCLSMNNYLFASMKKKVGYHETGQILSTPPATIIIRKR